MKTSSQASASAQWGASLIEVLVALLIISLGLMSMARLVAAPEAGRVPVTAERRITR